MGWFLTGGALLQNRSGCPGKLQLLGTCAAEPGCCRRLAQAWKGGETPLSSMTTRLGREKSEAEQWD